MSADSPLSTDSSTAALWRELCRRHLTYRSGVVDTAHRMVLADPGFALGRATVALLSALDGLPGLVAADELAAARSGRATTPLERSFVRAAGQLIEEGPWAARQAWLDHQQEFPEDLMAFAMVIFLIGYGFEPTDQALDELDRRHGLAAAAAGDDQVFLLGFAAMQAQERGDLERCRTLAERALRLDPTGYSGGHPMAHVYFESGEHVAGAGWLDPWLAGADRESSFHGHLAWHSALHHLANGDTRQTLARLAECSAPDRAARAIDGVSLLWRCQLDAVMPRSEDPARPRLAASAARLAEQPPYAFAGAHAALGLATAGDAESLRRLAETAAASAAPGVAEAVPGLANGLAAYLDGEPERAALRLLAVEEPLARIGGSHAQREVFEDTLIHVLIRAGRLEQAASRLRSRLDRRPSPQDLRRLARTAG